MAKQPTKRAKPSAAVKAAADAAVARSMGKPIEGSRVLIDPPIKRARTKRAPAPIAPSIERETAGAPARHPGGRPPDYHIGLCETAAEMYAQGAVDIEVADACKVHVSTLFRWRVSHPEFREASRLGKDAADNRVKASLYNRAVGYSYDSVKVFVHLGVPVVVPVREHVPPDVGAAGKWLAVRDPSWRDQSTVTVDASTAFVTLLKLVSVGQPT